MHVIILLLFLSFRVEPTVEDQCSVQLDRQLKTEILLVLGRHGGNWFVEIC